MEDIFKSLREQGINPYILEEIQAFREKYPAAPELKNRISAPELPYYGKEVFEMLQLLCLKGNICFSPDPRPRERTFLRRIWPMFSGGLLTIFPSM